MKECATTSLVTSVSYGIARLRVLLALFEDAYASTLFWNWVLRRESVRVFVLACRLDTNGKGCA